MTFRCFGASHDPNAHGRQRTFWFRLPAGVTIVAAVIDVLTGDGTDDVPDPAPGLIVTTLTPGFGTGVHELDQGVPFTVSGGSIETDPKKPEKRYPLRCRITCSDGSGDDLTYYLRCSNN